ncbi:MAG: pyridoxamine 5'-phosphate oxidase family protein [Rhodospirillales bacterium]
MDQRLCDQITSIIDAVDHMTIATLREDGFPQATTVSYVNEGLTLYFMTSAESQKARNIARDNRVSLTIDRDYDSWDEIESLSMAAYATPVSDPVEQEKIGKLLLAKYPQAADFEQMDFGELTFLRVEPKVISVLDYAKGFGHTELVAP